MAEIKPMALIESMKKKVLTVLMITVVASILFGSGFYAGAATTKGAGSQNDPVVSLSYLEYRLSKLGDVTSGGSNTGFSRKVTVENGERIMPGEGSLIIIYSGACTAVGNLIDTTEARALSEGMSVSPYSQILVPSDSSGVVASQTTVVYILGS